MSINNWMSWENGVDLCALTEAALPQPNVIVHVARMVHTPAGSSPSGMIFWQPDVTAPPVVFGFVSGCKEVGAYFGPEIFAGTPFEHAPVLDGTITITEHGDHSIARLETAGHVFEVTLAGLGDSAVIHRAPAAMTPFHQQGLERIAGSATLTVNGAAIPLILPPVGMSGGAAAVASPCGIYAR